MHKIVILLKRKPGLPVEAFQDYWLKVHGPIVAQGPGLRRYVQSHALPQGYAKGELPFDGIAELWFDSPQDYAIYRNSAVGDAARRDRENFLDLARFFLFPVEVHVILDGKIPEKAVKSIEVVSHRPGMPLAPFFRYWREVHGPLASRIPVLRRYEQNHTQAAAYEADEKPAYEGLAVTWFASTADMKQGTRTPEYEATRADEPNFLPDGHLPTIITREHQLVGYAVGPRVRGVPGTVVSSPAPSHTTPRDSFRKERPRASETQGARADADTRRGC